MVVEGMSDLLGGDVNNTSNAILIKKKKRVKTDNGINEVSHSSLKRPAGKNSSEDVDSKPTKMSKGVKFEVGNKARTDLGESNPKNRIKQFKPNHAEKAKAHAAFLAKACVGGSTDKPDWSVLKKETKEKRKERIIKKRTVTGYEISVSAKQLWEKLRIEKGDHTKTTNELHDLLKTHLSTLIFAHEMSRIVQWLLHLGSATMRTSIIEELQPCIKKMVESKYASKCVKKMLKYGSKASKITIVDCFIGDMVKLTSNVISAPVIEFAFANAATAVQQNRMRQEFYSDLFKLSKDDTVTCLADIFVQMSQLKDAHISCTKKNLTKMIEKKTFQSSLFYIVLNDYVQHCPKGDKLEFLTQIRETLVDTLDTEAASEVAMQCIILATNKEKKTVMKSLKGHIVSMAKARFNHKILLALFDCIDDTVAFSKIVLPEITSNVKELSEDQYGRKVVAYLVAHRHPDFFAANQCDRLQHFLTESASKKSTDVRQKDILDLVSPALLAAVADDAAFWFRDSKISLVAFVILKTGCGEPLSNAYKAVSQLVCNPAATVKEGKEVMPLIEHPGVHWVLKNLLKFDYPVGGRLFCTVLADILTDEAIVFWFTFNRGAFLLVHLLETGDETLTTAVKNKLTPFAAQLQKQTSHGATLLAKKLK